MADQQLYGVVLKYHASLKIIDYLMEIADFVSKESIKSFGKITGSYYGAFFEKENDMRVVLERKVLIINGIQVPVLPFQPTVKTIYIKGVPLVGDLTPLADYLCQFGGLRSGFTRHPIKDLPDGFAHVKSHTLSVKISVKDEKMIPNYAKIEFNSLTFNVKIEHGAKKCFKCGSRAHEIKMCRRNLDAFPMIMQYGKEGTKPLTVESPVPNDENDLLDMSEGESMSEDEADNTMEKGVVDDNENGEGGESLGETVLASNNHQIPGDTTTPNAGNEINAKNSETTENESLQVDNKSVVEDLPKEDDTVSDKGWMTPMSAKSKQQKRKKSAKHSDSASSEYDSSPNVGKKSVKVFDEEILRKVLNASCMRLDKIGNGHISKSQLMELLLAGCSSLERVPLIAKRYATSASLIKQQLTSLFAIIRNAEVQSYISAVLDALPVNLNPETNDDNTPNNLLE